VDLKLKINKMKMEQKFEDYLKQERKCFSKVASEYTVTEHLKLRTAIDSLLIAYDQAVNQVNKMRISEQKAKEQADLYQDFFNFLNQEHNLTCTIEEMDEIIHEAQTFVKKFDIANAVVPKGALCPCGGNERVASDCTMKPCKHPKFFKLN